MKRAVGAWATVLVLTWGGSLHAYDQRTHREIGGRAADPDVSTLDLTLRAELGFLRGIEETFPGIGERGPRSIRQLIGDGAFFEDVPPTRVINHFHNPLAPTWDEAGLTVFAGPVPLRLGQSSVLWQQNPAQDSLAGGRTWTWQEARRHFLNALTRPNKEDRGEQEGRDRAWARTFEALGRLTHLVQDATVPAHTRNDPHPYAIVLDTRIGNPDWYEDWVEVANNTSSSKLRALLNGPVGQPSGPIAPPSSIFTETGHQQAPVPVSRLIDSDTFRIDLGNVGDTTAAPAIGVSEYTNGNFLSRDTLFKEFAYPSQRSLDPAGFLVPEGSKFRRYFRKVADGEGVEFFVTEGALHRSLSAAAGTPPPAAGWFLDDRVHEEYAARLLPRAVGYSAALLDYFFRGRLEAELLPDPDDPSLLRVTATNASSDALVDGALTLYREEGTGERRAVASAPVDGVIRQGQELFAAPPSFPATADDAEGRFVAVYRGTLGLERQEGAFRGGVVGKVVGGVRVEEVFADGENWKLRTPKGVFLLSGLTVARFEEVRWGDGDDLLVARAPFVVGEPIRVVAYEIRRQPGSAEVVTVATPGGLAVPLTVKSEATFPPDSTPTVTTVSVASHLDYRQQIAKYERTEVYRKGTLPNGTESCELDRVEFTPLTVVTATAGGVSFQATVPIRLDVAHNGVVGTTFQPYVWYLQEAAATASGRLLGLVVVFLTSPEDPGTTVPFFWLNHETGALEKQFDNSFLPRFPGEINPLLWALVDLQSGEVLASTATERTSISFQEVANTLSSVWGRFRSRGCDGEVDLGWFKLPLRPPGPGDGIEAVEEVSTQLGMFGIAADGWLKPELEALRFNDQPVFGFQLAAVQDTGELVYDCVAIVARSCRVIRDRGTTGMIARGPLRLQDARRARPAPAGERLVFMGEGFAGAGLEDTILVWDPDRKSARVLFRPPAIPESTHLLGAVTGTAAMVIPAGGESFHLVLLEGPPAPAFFPEGATRLRLLNPRYLYHVDDLKFYRPRPPLEPTALPARLAEAPGNPVGDYHAIRLP